MYQEDNSRWILLFVLLLKHSLPLFLKKQSVFSTLNYITAIKKKPKKQRRHKNKQNLKSLWGCFLPWWCNYATSAQGKIVKGNDRKEIIFGLQGIARSFNTKWQHFSFSSLKKTSPCIIAKTNLYLETSIHWVSLKTQKWFYLSTCKKDKQAWVSWSLHANFFITNLFVFKITGKILEYF